MTKGRIIFVTNDYDTREHYRRLLDNYELLIFNDSEITSKELRHSHPDIVIIDLRLVDEDDDKDYSGLDLAKKLSRDIPKIILTDHPELSLTPSLALSNTYILSKKENPDVFFKCTKRLSQRCTRKFFG